MNFEERSYSGKNMRPTPEVHIEEDGSFGAIITPWGPRASVKRVIESLSDFILSAKNDMEATSPFQMLTCVSPLANSLRAGMMLANDTVYREDNKGEYQSGLEIFAFARNATEFCFVQIGHPHAFLHRNGAPLITLSSHVDLTMEWSQNSHWLAPLPGNMIGLHTTSNFQVLSFRPRNDDKLIFLSRSFLPAPLFQPNLELDSLTKALSIDDPEQPFWLGLYDLPNWSGSEEEVA
jgi:hypothetical protein